MGGTQELRWEEHRNYDGRNTGTTMGGTQELRWEEHRNYDGRNTGTTMGGTQELRWEEHRNYDGRNTGTTMGGTQEARRRIWKVSIAGSGVCSGSEHRPDGECLWEACI